MTKRIWRRYTILFIIIVPIFFLTLAIFIPFFVEYETDRINKVFLSTVPQQVNLTIEGNNTVSKRIGLSSGDNVVTLMAPKLEVPPQIDRNLTLIYNNTTPTNNYFIYIVANNSKYIFPEGSYEGIIRFYYIGPSGKVLNKAIPMDIKVVTNEKKH